jgi:hypothetical protein
MTTNSLDSIDTPSAATIEAALVGGDLSKLSTEQRLRFYNAVCQSLGLNPLTRPFAYLHLSGRLTLYALRDATDQLRKIHNISIEIVERQLLDDLYVVRARATTPSGRSDESLGAVTLGTARGEQRANAMMRAETKAKRRVALSICGLGWADESEVETIPGAQVVALDAPEPAPEVRQAPPPERPPLPTGPVYVESVTPAADRKSWALVFSSGEEAMTSKRTVAALAESFVKYRKPALVTTEDGAIVSLAAAPRELSPDPEPAPLPGTVLVTAVSKDRASKTSSILLSSGQFFETSKGLLAAKAERYREKKIPVVVREQDGVLTDLIDPAESPS